MWVRNPSSAWEPFPMIPRLLRQAQAECRPDCPPTKTHTPHPHPPRAQPFLSSTQNVQETWHTSQMAEMQTGLHPLSKLVQNSNGLRITGKKLKRQRKKLGNTETSFRILGWIRNLGRSCVIIFIFFIERRWEYLCSETFSDYFWQSDPVVPTKEASPQYINERALS